VFEIASRKLLQCAVACINAAVFVVLGAYLHVRFEVASFVKMYDASIAKLNCKLRRLIQKLLLRR